MLRQRLAAEFVQHANEAIAARGQAVVALSGGSVAVEFYPHLAGTGVDWSRVDFVWIDERAVPPDDPRSNYAVADRLWLSLVAVPQARIHRMPADDPDLEHAARAAANELIAVAGDPPRIDIALVGVGEDGHVGSIFPHGGSETRRESGGRVVVPVYDSPKPPARRLTQTMDVLASVRRAIIIAIGTSKARSIREALSGTTDTPMRQLLDRARAPLLLLDNDAGAGIGR